MIFTSDIKEIFGKLHCQQYLKLKYISYTIPNPKRSVRCAPNAAVWGWGPNPESQTSAPNPKAYAALTFGFRAWVEAFGILNSDFGVWGLEVRGERSGREKDLQERVG
jgi:hypothetical protein